VYEYACSVRGVYGCVCSVRGVRVSGGGRLRGFTCSSEGCGGVCVCA
jgi:hypothetical protein